MSVTVYCPKCGAENPTEDERCRSCGAGISGAALVDDREQEVMHFQQETFQWRWVLISFLVIAGLHSVLVFVVFRMVLIDDIFAQMALGLIPYVIGGVFIGWLSPGKTFLEPFYAAVLPAVVFPPLVEWFNVQAQRPEDLNEALAIFNWPVGLAPILVYILITLFGAWVGEKIQGTV